jgi:hypothetical protein
VEQCPSSGPKSGFGQVITATTPAVLCVRLYYYSATPLTLNLTSALSIQAVKYAYNGSVGAGRPFSGAYNFTVVVSQASLTLGGPSDKNEGTIVAYSITAKPGASGTYQLGYLPSSSLNTYLLDPQEPKQCGYYGSLVAGDGQPNYVQPTGCITYATTSNSNSMNIPGISYSLTSGYLYFEIVGVISSAG